MPPFVIPRGSVAMHTRMGGNIDNFFDRSAVVVGMIAKCENYKIEYAQSRPRPTLPTSIYNCHGLTFGSRRSGISDPAIVRKILTEDEFTKVNEPDVHAGDIVAYISDNGDVDHSGIVMSYKKAESGILPVVWILSKWGECHEALHLLRDCPYPVPTIEYYRITK